MQKTGRLSADLCLELKKAIGEGRFRAGAFLPGQRELATTYSVSRITVRRTMKQLADDGYVTAEPRRGCRVLPRANDPDVGCPIAFVHSKELADEGFGHFGRCLGELLKAEAAERGWKFMHMLEDRVHMPDLVREISGTRAWGMMVDTAYPEVMRAAVEQGLPVVTVDSWSDAVSCDGVVKDDFGGAYQAASCLLERGHESIAWLGSSFDGRTSRTRLGGASAALVAAGSGFSSVHRLPYEHEARVEYALKVLRRKSRPTAVLALWMSIAAPVVEAATQLGLKVGEDIEVVGWCAEEIHELWQKKLGAAGGRIPAVVWSARDMVRTAVKRLAERRLDPGMPATRLTVPARLMKLQSEADKPGGGR